jgi:hypothetical protein
MFTTSRPFWAIALCSMATTTAAAANKPERIDRVVDAILEREARGDVNRRATDLGDLVSQSDRARWAAGYVHAGGEWQKFDTAPRGDDRIRHYSQRRGNEPLSNEQHLALADWCRDRKLPEQERAHLKAALEIDPNQPNIWKRLDLEIDHGELISRKEQARRKSQEQSLERNLRTWNNVAQGVLNRLVSKDEGTRRLGRTNLNDINDDQAIFALETKLTPVSPDVAGEFIDYLSNRETLGSTTALARQAVLSPWEPIRSLSADKLKLRRADHFAPTLLSTISTPLEFRQIHFNPQKVQAIQLNGPVKVLTNGSMRTYSRIAMVNTAEIKAEKWGRSYHVMVQEVCPLLVFGRARIRTVLPDFHNGSGYEQLTDLNRELLAESSGNEQALIEALLHANQGIKMWNDRVANALTRAGVFPPGLGAKEMWSAWAAKTHTDPDAEKQEVFAGTLREISERPLIDYNPNIKSCLPPETMISTSCGLQPIESLRIGDLVLAKDIETGELSYQPVIRTTVRTPQPLITLHTKDDSIRATLGHYFWVSGQGWRMAKEIKPGDRIHSVEGTATVTDISHGGREAVYNLVVEGANTYFVGMGKILSHDVTPPVPTDIIVPGLAAR